MRQSDYDLSEASEVEDDFDAEIARKEAKSMLLLLNQVTLVDQAQQPPANAVQEAFEAVVASSPVIEAVAPPWGASANGRDVVDVDVFNSPLKDVAKSPLQPDSTTSPKPDSEPESPAPPHTTAPLPKKVQMSTEEVSMTIITPEGSSGGVSAGREVPAGASSGSPDKVEASVAEEKLLQQRTVNQAKGVVGCLLLIVNPKLSTLHPNPKHLYQVNATPSNLNHDPQTLNFKPRILNHTP